MKTLSRISTILLTALLLAACSSGTDEAADTQEEAVVESPSVAGNWSGVLDAQGQKFELLFKVNQADDGTITASIDSVSQNVNDIPVEVASYTDGRLLLEAKSILGVLDVRLDGADKLTGKWNQGGVSYPMELQRQ
jgi:hypothetical protein